MTEKELLIKLYIEIDEIPVYYRFRIKCFQNLVDKIAEHTDGKTLDLLRVVYQDINEDPIEFVGMDDWEYLENSTMNLIKFFIYPPVYKVDIRAIYKNCGDYISNFKIRMFKESTTVKEIKEKIQVKTGIKVHDQKLFFKKNELVNDIPLRIQVNGEKQPVLIMICREK